MKDEVINTNDGKKYTFSTYFVINNLRLFSVDNFNFEENLSNCFYVKKLGSNIYPKIYVDIKVNNKWVIQDQIIGDYNAFMRFILQNRDSVICIRGFSRANMYRFVRIFNELSETNIKIVKFNKEITKAQYERHLLKKEEKMVKIKKRLEESGEIDNSLDYLKITNSVLGEGRHKARRKIINK